MDIQKQFTDMSDAELSRIKYEYEAQQAHRLNCVVESLTRLERRVAELEAALKARDH